MEVVNANFPLANSNLSCTINPNMTVTCALSINNITTTYNITVSSQPSGGSSGGSTQGNLMINSVNQHIDYEVCRNDNCVPMTCTLDLQYGNGQTAQSAANLEMSCADANNVLQRIPLELTIPHQVDPTCNIMNRDGDCEMEICTLEGNKLNCSAPAQFTNVNGLKSKRERKVESFSQIKNGKCKTRY